MKIKHSRNITKL